MTTNETFSRPPEKGHIDEETPMPQSESGDPTGRDWNRQVEEHNATTLPLLNFSDPPPGWIWIGDHEGCALAEGASSIIELLPLPLPRAWENYKFGHDPPGMWCGFSRSVDDLDNCSIRVGVHACGARWELQPDITVPYEGFTVRARAWAWAWYERRHALMAKISKVIADQRQLDGGAYRIAVSLILTDRAPFHRVLCWHDEWVDEVEAWIEKPSSTVPEALR